MPRTRNQALRLHLTRLENRTVPDATASFAAGVLTVTGDAGVVDDDLSVELVAGKIKVFKNATTAHDALPIANEPAKGLRQTALTQIIVNAGDGNDTVFISAAIKKPAELHGGSGNDNLTGGSGNDLIFGDDGVDSLNGGKGNDTITGGNGDGVLQGDVIIGGDGNDSLTGGPQDDEIYGGAGDDTINAGDGDDHIRGDDPAAKKGGNDVINGEGGDDIIAAGKGNDLVNGGDGNDTVEAGDGNDTVTGGADFDLAFTGPDDLGAGAADADVIYGGAGNDSLVGGWGNDLLYGEAGNDTLTGGVGQDVLSGGLGQDKLIGHGVTGGNSGSPTDEGNFDTYKDEFDLTKPVLGKAASVKDIAPTELAIQPVLAGFAAVANNQTNFNIASRIRYLGDGDYLVKLGKSDEINPDPSSPNPFGWVPVHFDGTWTDNDPRPSAQERLPKARDSREFWPILLDRAIATSFNASYDPLSYYTQTDYENLDVRLTQPEAVVEELTGAGSTTFALSPSPPAGFTVNDIKSDVAFGKWVTVTASGSPGLGLQADQAYAVVAVKTGKKGNFITLYNPSGFDKGTSPLGTIDVGKAADDGFITLSETDFFANFVTGYVNA
jgi:Ca2+-binding RTX toxin-like protein